MCNIALSQFKQSSPFRLLEFVYCSYAKGEVDKCAVLEGLKCIVLKVLVRSLSSMSVNIEKGVDAMFVNCRTF